MTFDLVAWSAARRATVDEAMAALFTDAWPEDFAAPCRYPLFSGGKRVRPLLALAAAEALGADPEVAIPPAIAVELIHTYSLVHDDLPAMDDDDERRGQPTVHVAFDEATAILAGDALLTEAFSVLARAPAPAATRVDWVATLADAAGHRGMVGGQAGDVGLGAAITDVATLLGVHSRKTGALIRAAVVMGGAAAGAEGAVAEALSVYGREVGLAFQLADDVLDADEDAGADGPPSYVRLLGEGETRRRAEACVGTALDALAGLPAPAALQALARFIVDRDV